MSVHSMRILLVHETQGALVAPHTPSATEINAHALLVGAVPRRTPMDLWVLCAGKNVRTKLLANEARFPFICVKRWRSGQRRGDSHGAPNSAGYSADFLSGPLLSTRSPLRVRASWCPAGSG
ncbi:unnamed protein product, partial [Ectocarpus sp. 12 AP-2014]